MAANHQHFRAAMLQRLRRPVTDEAIADDDSAVVFPNLWAHRRVVADLRQHKAAESDRVNIGRQLPHLREMRDGRRDVAAVVVKHAFDTRNGVENHVSNFQILHVRADFFNHADLLIAGHVRKRQRIVFAARRVAADAFATHERPFGAVADPRMRNANHHV